MPGGQRAWPHDRVLALYWYLRLDPISGKVMSHERATATVRHGSCTRIVAFLCDMGAALQSLPMIQRCALESRWSAWDRAAYCSGRIARLRSIRQHELRPSSDVAIALDGAMQEWRNLRAHYREHQRRIEQTEVYRAAQDRLADELLTRDLVARAVDHRLGLTLLGDCNLKLEELGATALERLNVTVSRFLESR